MNFQEVKAENIKRFKNFLFSTPTPLPTKNKTTTFFGICSRPLKAEVKEYERLKYGRIG